MATSTLPSVVAHTGTWHLDPAHFEVGFAVRHMMISTVKGRFGGVRGTVTVQGDDLATAEVQATIDVATIDTREPQRDAHLRSADFFDADQYPTMTFQSRRVDAEPNGRYRLVGDLTIRGVSREVSLEVESEGTAKDPWGNERAGFNARGTLNRRDFGMTFNHPLETGGVLVGDTVKIAIEAELIRQA